VQFDYIVLVVDSPLPEAVIAEYAIQTTNSSHEEMFDNDVPEHGSNSLNSLKSILSTKSNRFATITLVIPKQHTRCGTDSDNSTANFAIGALSGITGIVFSKHQSRRESD
jgi:hypothetical protein